jgi:hypothetical protein
MCFAFLPFERSLFIILSPHVAKRLHRRPFMHMRHASSSFSSMNNGTIVPATSIVSLNPASPVTLHSTAPISTSVPVGTILILKGTSDVNTVTINESAHVCLGAVSRTLGQKDALTLLFDGMDWIELPFTNN